MIRLSRIRAVAALVGILWVLFVGTAMPARDLPGWVCTGLWVPAVESGGCCGPQGGPEPVTAGCCGSGGDAPVPAAVRCCDFEQGPALPAAPAPRVASPSPIGDLAPPPALALREIAPRARLLPAARGAAPAYLDSAGWISFVGRAPPSRS